MRPIAIAVFLASFFGFLGIFASWFVSLAFFLVSAIGIGFFIQHETVSQMSLPLVFTQPVIPGQRLMNNFYKITVSELKGAALSNYQHGIGYVKVSEGVVKFQAFKPQAIAIMQKARCYSRIMLGCYILAFGYNIFWLWAALVAKRNQE